MEMKKFVISFIILVFHSIIVFSQKLPTTTLDDCIKAAYANSPIGVQCDYNNQVNLLKTENLNKQYLPQFSINSQISYQSDVTSINIDLPAFRNILPEPISKTQYKTTVDINQILFDGGVTSSQKKLEEVENKINLKNIDVKLYNLKDLVSQLYFNIILINKNKQIINSAINTLESKLNKLSSAVKYGSALPSDTNVIKIEILKNQQQIIQLNSSLLSSLNSLNIITKLQLDTSTMFLLPDISTIINFDTMANFNRHELQLYSLQQNKLDVLSMSIFNKNRPKLFLFAQAGYGRPGFNFLNNDPDFFYITGVKFTWTPYNWNQTKKEKQILDVQKNIILSEKENFIQNLMIKKDNILNEMEQYESLIEKDKLIIDRHKQIVNTYSAQLDNGMLTVSDYVTAVNNLTQAEITTEIHKIKLIKSKYDYINVIGK